MATRLGKASYALRWLSYPGDSERKNGLPSFPREDGAFKKLEVAFRSSCPFRK